MKKNLVSLLLLICFVLSPAIGLTADGATINVILCCEDMKVQKIITYEDSEDIGHYHPIFNETGLKIHVWCNYTVYTEGGHKECSNCGGNHGTWSRTWEGTHIINWL